MLGTQPRSGGCCPCTPITCPLCLDLPDILHATVTGTGVCNCFSPTIVQLNKVDNACNVGIEFAPHTGWIGQAPWPCPNSSEVFFQVGLCCLLFPGTTGYSWFMEFQTLPHSLCSLSSFTNPGNSCHPLNETHIFAPDSALICCDPAAMPPGDSIKIVITV
jgi:hypothetical protein